MQWRFVWGHAWVIAGVSLASIAALPAPIAAEELQIEVANQTADEAAAEARLGEALEETTEISFFEDSLEEAALFIGDYHNVQIEVDEPALEAAGLRLDIPLTRELRGVTLQSALNLLLAEYDLTYVFDGGKILITTPEKAETYLSTRTYHCAPLLAGEGGDAWIETITYSIDYMSWEVVGGLGEIELSADGESIIVTQTLPTHIVIEDLLCQALELQASIEAGSSPEELEVQPIGLTSPQQAVQEKIEAALVEEAEVSFFEDPLSDVVLYLESYHELQIEIDIAALIANGLDTQIPFTCELRNTTLASALNLILAEYDLTFTIEDEVLLITTPQEAESEMPACLYTSEAIRDLDAQEAKALVDLVISLIEPMGWSCNGSVGDIYYLPVPGALLVTQTHTTQKKIESLLAQLSTPLPADADDELHIGWVASSPVAAQREAAIVAGLSQPTAYDFFEDSLADVVLYLSAYHEITIVIEEHALSANSLPVDLPITLDGEFDTLASGLAALLEPHKLTWRMGDEVLHVTTPQEAECRGLFRIYRGGPVADLVADDPDTHLETIVTSISPESWEEAGGCGSIVYCDSCKALVVNQSVQVQLEIEAYLRELAGGP